MPIRKSPRTLLIPICCCAMIGSGLMPRVLRACNGGSAPVSSEEYFPKGVFETSSPNGRFRATWYACTLASLKEASLLGFRRDDHNQVYRFLWLPSFDRPVSVRVTINPDGGGSVVAKSVDLESGSAVLRGDGKSAARGSGKLTIDTATQADETQVRDLLRKLESIKFWAMATDEAHSIDPPPHMADGQTMVPVPPVDGARWVLEGVRNGEYHVVDRWSPKDGGYARLGKYFLTLGKVNLKNLY